MNNNNLKRMPNWYNAVRRALAANKLNILIRNEKLVFVGDDGEELMFMTHQEYRNRLNASQKVVNAYEREVNNSINKALREKLDEYMATASARKAFVYVLSLAVMILWIMVI